MDVLEISGLIKHWFDLLRPEVPECNLSVFNESQKYYLNMIESFNEGEEPEKILDISNVENIEKFFRDALMIEAYIIQTLLPIYNNKIKVVNGITYHNFMIFDSPTGTGKSSQIPLYLFCSPFFCQTNVLVIESNKIAAKSLASKVKQDMKGVINVLSCTNEEFLNCRQESPSLIYFDGFSFLSWLLEEMSLDVPLKRSKVVFIDDIHESCAEIEVILEFLLKLVATKRPDLRIVFCSASFNDHQLESYLNSFIVKFDPKLRNSSYIEEKLYMKTVKIKVDEQNYEVKEFFVVDSDRTLKDICRMIERIFLDEICKKILVFVSCDSDTHELKSLIKKMTEDIKVYVLTENSENFKSKNVLKLSKISEKIVIITTKFLEGSITIPDISHVLDAGTEKLQYVRSMNVYENVTKNISLTSATQRKGRAGRDSSGICYKLYTREQQSLFDHFRIPQIDFKILDKLFLMLLKHGFDPLKLNLINKMPDYQKEATFNKLHSSIAIDYDEDNLDYKIKIEEIGLAALEFDVSVHHAAMIVRSCFNFESILLGSVIEYNELFIDRQEQNDYLFNHPEVDDFMIQVIVARQYCLIRCDACSVQFGSFLFTSQSDYISLVTNSCTYCEGLRNRWAKILKVKARFVKKALKLCSKVLKKAKRKNIQITSFIEKEHYINESIFLKGNSSSNFKQKLLESYLKTSKILKTLLLIVFAHNICENISEQGVIAYRYLRQDKFAVPSISCFLPSIQNKEFVICKSLEKVGHKYIMNFTVGYDFNEVNEYASEILETYSYETRKNDFKLLFFQNIGERFRKQLKVNNCKYFSSMEKEFAKKNIDRYLLICSKEESCFKVLIGKNQEEECSSVMKFCISKLLCLIESGEKVHVSLGDNYIGVIMPGYEIKELVSPKNEIRYKISGLDPSISNNSHLKEIKSTFSVKYVNIQKTGKLVEAFLYFSDKSQAENAQSRLRMFPLKGCPSIQTRVSEMEPLLEGATRGTIAKVVISCYVTQSTLEDILGPFNPAHYELKKCNTQESIIKVYFNSREATEYFVYNYRPTFKRFLNISSANVKLVGEGISIPNELLKIYRLPNYIENLSKTFRTQIFLNLNKKKIYSQFDEIPIAAQEKIYQLINNDILEVPRIVWMQVQDRCHYLENEEMDFETFQSKKEVSCAYEPVAKIIQIFGLPEQRSEFLEYLKEFTSEIMNDLRSSDFEISKKLNRGQVINEIYSNFPSIELNFDDHNTRKFSASGLSQDIEAFTNFFNQDNPTSPSFIECEVCHSDKTFSSHRLGICGHLIHKPCFVNQLKINMSTSLFPIKCFLCGNKVLYQDLVTLCPYEVIKTIEKISLSKYIKGAGIERFDVCKVPNCGYLYEKSSIDSTKMTRYCPKCNYTICVKCHFPATRYHNIECEKNWIMNNDKQLSSWIAQNASTCPKCGISVEKSGGCNHMTCEMCSTHYCFICLKIITDKKVMDHFMVPNTICYRKYINNNPNTK